METDIDELESRCFEGDAPEENEDFITVAELLEKQFDTDDEIDIYIDNNIEDDDPSFSSNNFVNDLIISPAKTHMNIQNWNTYLIFFRNTCQAP